MIENTVNLFWAVVTAALWAIFVALIYAIVRYVTLEELNNDQGEPYHDTECAKPEYRAESESR